METELTEICCANKDCRVMFWITDSHDRRLRNCHNTFYCPNGHPQSYKGETDGDKLKRAEQNLKGERQYSNHLAKSNSALRGVITRMKNKAGSQKND